MTKKNNSKKQSSSNLKSVVQNIGYIRVSSIDQNTARQLDGMKLDKTFTDKVSGKNTNRPELKNCIEYARGGDIIHVHSMDRLARNLSDLEKIVDSLTKKGIEIKFHKECLTFSGKDDMYNKLMLQIMGAVAQFERSNIKERQREGIKKAKEAGQKWGQAPIINDEKLPKMIEMIETGVSRKSVANEFGISTQTLYRTLKKNGYKLQPLKKPVSIVEI